MKIMAQRVTEALAFADTNYDSNKDKDQEVFGICVRHRYITFWHGVFPTVHPVSSCKPFETPVCLLLLELLVANCLSFEDTNLYSLLKCYPASNYGLDLCNAADRVVIVQGIYRITKYMERSF